MNPPVPPGPEPDPDPPEPVGNTMSVKIKNTTNADFVFHVRAYTGTTDDPLTDQAVKLALNEEHTFTVSLGDADGFCIKGRLHTTSYPDPADTWYWTNGSQIKWKVNYSDTATYRIPYADGADFSGVYDATQNYATQS